MSLSLGEASSFGLDALASLFDPVALDGPAPRGVLLDFGLSLCVASLGCDWLAPLVPAGLVPWLALED